MKAVLRALIRILVLLGFALAALSVPFAFRALHRLEEPWKPETPAMGAALTLAREAVEYGAGVRAGKPESKRVPFLLDAPAGPVFVSVYGLSIGGVREPAVGRWIPSGTDTGVTLAAALAIAGEEAGRALKDSLKPSPTNPDPSSSLKSTRIKIDLAGPARAVWAQWDPYLELVMDPGRDGLVARAGKKEAYFLPSWTAERDWKPGRALKWLRSRVTGREGEMSVARFRSASFVEGVEEEPGPLEVFRGNVLVPEVSSSTVLRSLTLAGGYLARMVGDNGRFCYDYNAATDRCGSDYNLLRHAGTAYSMYQIYQDAPDTATLQAAERAMEWLRKQVRPVDGDPTRAYMLEDKRAKLGAVGLGLLAFVEREKVVKDGRDRALMTRLADFIRSQQREDGYLESYFAWKKGEPVPEDRSIYYPGEALLGLVRLYGIDPQQRWLDTAAKSADYLALKRWSWAGIELYVPPDAWLTQALAELYPLTRDEALKAYCYRIIDVTRQTQLKAEEGAVRDMMGGPIGGLELPSVTPAGSRNEGLTAAWRMATGAKDTEQAALILATSIQSAGFQLSQQFRPANAYYLPNPARAMGAFRSRADNLDVRIDYVQHNATGLSGLLHILKQEGR